MKYPDINIEIEYQNKLINADAQLFGKKSRFGDSKTFCVSQRKVVFPFFHEAFWKVAAF